MKRFLVVAILAAAYPAVAGAASFHGTVVSRQAGNIAVAGSSGLVRTVQTRSHAAVGAVVSVSATRLANGTYSASRFRVTGFSRHARITGTVLRRQHGWTIVTAGRSALAIHSARTLASVGDTGPQPGTVVNTSVQIASGQLQQTAMQPVGQTGAVTIQAVISAVGPGTITLNVNGQPVQVSLPAGLTLPASVVGQTVQLQLTFANGGVTAEQDDQGDNNDDQGGNSQGDNGQGNASQGATTQGDNGGSGDD